MDMLLWGEVVREGSLCKPYNAVSCQEKALVEFVSETLVVARQYVSVSPRFMHTWVDLAADPAVLPRSAQCLACLMKLSLGAAERNHLGRAVIGSPAVLLLNMWGLVGRVDWKPRLSHRDREAEEH